MLVFRTISSTQTFSFSCARTRSPLTSSIRALSLTEVTAIHLSPGQCHLSCAALSLFVLLLLALILAEFPTLCTLSKQAYFQEFLASWCTFSFLTPSGSYAILAIEPRIGQL